MDVQAAEAGVPFVDLTIQHRALKSQIDAAVERVIDTSGFILGTDVAEFEREFAAYLDVKHTVGVSSGTDAIHLTLRALDIGPGHEVILPAMTFLATATGVLMAGATPVLADIDPHSYHLDPTSVRDLITERTRAILPVHLYGQVVDLAPLRALAGEHGLRLIEDACQAHGARDGHGRRAGTLGDAGCFSFYPSKNLGAMGDAGAIATDNDALAERLQWFRHHGQRQKNDHAVIGYTNRIDTVHAAVLRVKLPHLDRWNEQRRQVAARMDDGLKDLPVLSPVAARDHVYHLYVVRTDQRDALLSHLSRAGIGTGVHYPTPIHGQPQHARSCRRADDLSVSEGSAREILSLPMFPGMTEAQVDRTIRAVRSFFAG